VEYFLLVILLIVLPLRNKLLFSIVFFLIAFLASISSMEDEYTRFVLYFDGFYNGIIVDTLNYLYKEKGELFQDIKYIITYTFNKQRHYRSYKNWIDGYEAYIKMSGYRFYSDIKTNFNVHLFSEANAYNTELKNNTNHESTNINNDIDISLLD